MKKMVSVFLVVVMFIGILSGCGNRYSDVFAGKTELIEMMEEAIDSLQLCLDGKIGLDRIGDELVTISEKYRDKIGDDSASGFWVESLALDGKILSAYSINWKYGDESTDGMMDKVKEVKEGLEKYLYK